jgi:hypothetical protein
MYASDPQQRHPVISDSMHAGAGRVEALHAGLMHLSRRNVNGQLSTMI